MFSSSSIKQAKSVVHSARKFLHFRKDLLPKEKLHSIESDLKLLEKGIRSRDKAHDKELEKICERISVSCEGETDGRFFSTWAENLEVIFVVAVLLTGITKYFAQNFKIPTGSMQPTLHGVNIYSIPKDADGAREYPSWPQRFFERAIFGRKYVDLRLPRDEIIIGIKSRSRLRFMHRTILRCQSGQEYILPCRTNEFIELAQDAFTPVSSSTNARQIGENYDFGEGFKIRANDPRMVGYIETGDQLFVNKISYHFRKPRRGEIFVFTTHDIKGIENSPSFDPRQGAQHYIKRLVGLPGDIIDIRPPKIFINGKVAEEFGMERVMSQRDGYKGYSQAGKNGDFSYTLGLKEYMALGDNSTNSSDSRMWGFVPEKNLVGPALFVYWPFSKRWGAPK